MAPALTREATLFMTIVMLATLFLDAVDTAAFTFPCTNGTYDASSFESGSVVSLKHCPNVTKVAIRGNTSLGAVNILSNVALDFVNCSALTVWFIDVSTDRVTVSIENSTLWAAQGFAGLMIINSLLLVHGNFSLFVRRTSFMSLAGDLGGIYIHNVILKDSVVSIRNSDISINGTTPFLMMEAAVVNSRIEFASCKLVGTSVATVQVSSVVMSSSSTMTFADTALADKLVIDNCTLLLGCSMAFINFSTTFLMLQATIVEGVALRVSNSPSFGGLAIVHTSIKGSNIMLEGAVIDRPPLSSITTSFVQVQISTIIGSVIVCSALRILERATEAVFTIVKSNLTNGSVFQLSSSDVFAPTSFGPHTALQPMESSLAAAARGMELEGCVGNITERDTLR